MLTNHAHTGLERWHNSSILNQMKIGWKMLKSCHTAQQACCSASICVAPHSNAEKVLISAVQLQQLIAASCCQAQVWPRDEPLNQTPYGHPVLKKRKELSSCTRTVKRFDFGPTIIWPLELKQRGGDTQQRHGRNSYLWRAMRMSSGLYNCLTAADRDYSNSIYHSALSCYRLHGLSSLTWSFGDLAMTSAKGMMTLSSVWVPRGAHHAASTLLSVLKVLGLVLQPVSECRCARSVSLWIWEDPSHEWQSKEI